MKYVVKNTQTGHFIFQTNNYNTACRMAFAEIDRLEKANRSSEWINVVDGTTGRCMSMVYDPERSSWE